jgi:hypothetical protein
MSIKRQLSEYCLLSLKIDLLPLYMRTLCQESLVFRYLTKFYLNNVNDSKMNGESYEWFVEMKSIGIWKQM